MKKADALIIGKLLDAARVLGIRVTAFRVTDQKMEMAMEKKGGNKMSQVDQLDFERMRNIAEGFGWKIKQTEILDQTLKMMMEKERVEPETDITVQPG